MSDWVRRQMEKAEDDDTIRALIVPHRQSGGIRFLQRPDSLLPPSI